MTNLLFVSFKQTINALSYPLKAKLFIYNIKLLILTTAIGYGKKNKCGLG